MDCCNKAKEALDKLNNRCDELVKVLERIKEESSYEGNSLRKQLTYVHGAAREALNKIKKELKEEKYQEFANLP